MLGVNTSLAQPSILSGWVNEHRLRLGRFKAGSLCATLLGARHVPDKIGCYTDKILYFILYFY